MSNLRRPGLRFWIPALLVCAALAAGLLTSGSDPTLPTTPKAQAPDTGPDLLGAEPARGAGAQPAPVPGPADDTLGDGAADAEDGTPASDHLADADGEGDPSDDDPLADAHMRDGQRLTAAHPLVAPVIAVQDRHTPDLMAVPGVVGVGTSMNDRGEIIIQVFGERPVAGLPTMLDGVPVEFEVTGPFEASRGGPPGGGGGGGGGGGRKPKVDPTARFPRPVPIGVSTGHPDVTAGTIGCRVTDGSNVYALSNNHVYADSNAASIGDDVLQPGTFDGGQSPADDLGTLDDFEPIDFSGTNTMDAAIAAVSASDLGDSTPSDGYGTPKSNVIAPALNERVVKYGRTTGQTKGTIGGINFTVNVNYGAPGVATFVGQIVITPGAFSAGGDSGSLIVVQKGADARRPVGLLFAGSNASTIACPIGPVLSRFGVTIDGD